MKITKGEKGESRTVLRLRDGKSIGTNILEGMLYPMNKGDVIHLSVNNDSNSFWRALRDGRYAVVDIERLLDTRWCMNYFQVLYTLDRVDE